MKKFIALTAAILSLGIAGVATEASAKGKHSGFSIHIGGGHNHYRHFRHWSYAPVYVAPSCGWEYSKWQRTGSSYWKREYYVCKGWW